MHTTGAPKLQAVQSELHTGIEDCKLQWGGHGAPPGKFQTLEGGMHTELRTSVKPSRHALQCPKYTNSDRLHAAWGASEDGSQQAVAACREPPGATSPRATTRGLQKPAATPLSAPNVYAMALASNTLVRVAETPTQAIPTRDEGAYINGTVDTMNTTVLRKRHTAVCVDGCSQANGRSQAHKQGCGDWFSPASKHGARADQP